MGKLNVSINPSIVQLTRSLEMTS